jgi:hypothetical protein
MVWIPTEAKEHRSIDAPVANRYLLCFLKDLQLYCDV